MSSTGRAGRISRCAPETASWLLVLAAGALLGGCSGAGPPVGRADAVVPADLTIDVTVLVGPVTTPHSAQPGAATAPEAASAVASHDQDDDVGGHRAEAQSPDGSASGRSTPTASAPKPLAD